TAYMEHDRGVVPAGQPAAPPRVPARGVKVRGVDAATPHDGFPDSALDERVAHCLAGRLRQPGGSVEPTQPAPDQRLEHPGAVVPGVLRKVCVIRGHERHARAYGVTPPREADRPFGRDVHEVGAKSVQVTGDGPEL